VILSYYFICAKVLIIYMKGSMLDLIFIPVILFVVGISVFVASYLMTQIPTDQFGSATAQHALNMGTAAINTFNYGFLIIGVGLGIGAVILGFIYPSHPIFLVIGVIVLVFSMITTPIISNAFGTFIEDSRMTTVSANFPYIIWFMGDPLPLITSVFGFLLLIVMYSRIRGGTA